ncbi:MAG: hypothetical protein NZ700_01400 [Gemmataceae bacterium]|nr:hypothetical protein [Gemmataceae bacterium]MDW8266784.1 hypothetical protein [Gemmataceae bacterium]
MGAFRRVEGAQAGPEAVGILVPPGPRTLVVLRPRALRWDLVPVRRTAEGRPGRLFLELGRGEAVVVAEQLGVALERGWLGGTAAEPADPAVGFLVRVAIGPFSLLACTRLPGQPYQPTCFATLAEAQAAAAQIAAVLCPPPDAPRDLYFNTRFFTSHP